MKSAVPPPAADFQALFEQSPNACVVLAPDAAFTIVAVTQAYLRATGTRREALLGRGFFEVFPDHPRDAGAADAHDVRASLERVLATRAPDRMAVQKYDTPRPESEGGGLEARYWRPLNTPVLGEDGQVRLLVRQLEDVTLGVLKDLLSEELRNPLDVVQLGVNFLLSRDVNYERTRRGLLSIQAAARRARRIVEELSPKFHGCKVLTLSNQALHLHDVVRQGVEKVQTTYPERALQLRQEGDVHGRGDPDRLALVVANLVTYAVTSSPPDTAVTVVTRGEEDALVLEVHHQGPPLPPEGRKQLFEGEWKGSGAGDASSLEVRVGLYIVKEVVERHGGTVGVTSTAEEGTTVTVRLPRGRVPPQRD